MHPSIPPSLHPHDNFLFQEIIELIFNDYNVNARPVIEGSDAVVIAVQFELTRIEDLVIKTYNISTCSY